MILTLEEHIENKNRVLSLFSNAWFKEMQRSTYLLGTNSIRKEAKLLWLYAYAVNGFIYGRDDNDLSETQLLTIFSKVNTMELTLNIGLDGGCGCADGSELHIGDTTIINNTTIVNPTTTITGNVQKVTLNGDGSVAMPADCEISKIVILGPNNTTLTVATATEVIADSIDIVGGTKYRVINSFSLAAGQSIFFTGISGATTIEIYKD